MNGYRQLAGLMKSLAHPARLQILKVLEEEGEACVCHLEIRLGQRQAYISQQLANLREAGLVEDRRDGLNVYYGLTPVAISALIELAQEVASEIAGAKGLDITFPTIRRAHPETCRCPKCEQKLGNLEEMQNTTLQHH